MLSLVAMRQYENIISFIGILFFCYWNLLFCCFSIFLSFFSSSFRWASNANFGLWRINGRMWRERKKERKKRCQCWRVSFFGAKIVFHIFLWLWHLQRFALQDKTFVFDICITFISNFHICCEYEMTYIRPLK